MARGVPFRVVKPKPPGKFTVQQPKPCPTCYRPMRMVAGVFRCPTHGEATRP